MEIRKAESKDGDQLLKILKELGWFEKYVSSKDNLIKQNILEILNNNNHSIYVAEKENGLVAYISVHWITYLFLDGPEGYISELFVDENERGKGIGQKLIDIVISEARAKKCSRLSLINGKNRVSYERKFYEKIGFIKRDRMVNFILNLR